MTESEFYYVFGLGIPICVTFAIGTLIVLLVQAYQLANQEQTSAAKRAAVVSRSGGAMVKNFITLPLIKS